MTEEAATIEESQFYTLDKKGRPQVRFGVLLSSHLQLINVILHTLVAAGCFGCMAIALYFFIEGEEESIMTIIFLSAPFLMHLNFLNYMLRSRRISRIPTITQVFAVIVTVMFSFPAVILPFLFIYYLIRDGYQERILPLIGIGIGSIVCFTAYLTMAYACSRLKHQMRKIRRDNITTRQTMRRLRNG